MNAGLVETESAATYAAKAVVWDSQKHLPLALPFLDLKPTVYLGTYMYIHVYLSIPMLMIHVF